MPPAVFDRAHLSRYSMNNPALEAEIIQLFLEQLPATLEAIRLAQTAQEWRLATHTLKGSAGAIGAWQLHALAAELEALGPAPASPLREALLADLAAAIAELRRTLAPIFP
jgi:HPt (histidine-containing phosphotransfer) domain-containing protein